MEIQKKYIIDEKDKATTENNGWGTIREKFANHNAEDVLEEYDYESNFPLTPDNSYGSKETKIYFKCGEKGHKYSMTIGNRISGHGCPYCSGRAVLGGENDFKTIIPNWAERWSKNNHYDPEEVSWCCGKKAKFICEGCNKEFETAISSITHRKGSGGVYCKKCATRKAGDKISEKIGMMHPITETDPDILKYWDYEKNDADGIDPNKVSRGSEKDKINWKCPDCGCEWQATANQMTYKNRNCPECTRRRTHLEASKKAALKNSLLRKYPAIAEEYSEENERKVDDISAGSGIVVLWKCKKCGKEYEATPNDRTSLGKGCPECGWIKSIPQEVIRKALIDYYDVEYNYRKLFQRKEFDIFIPEIKTVIEYDGSVYHGNGRYNTTYRRDAEKNKQCLENGIRMIRIREKPLRKLKRCENIMIDVGNRGTKKYINGLVDALNQLFEMLGIKKRFDFGEVKEIYLSVRTLKEVGKSKKRD